MEVKEAADLLDNLIGMVEDNHGADYDTALKMGIEALSTSGYGPEPVDDTISRQAAIDALHMHLMYRMGTDSNKKRLDDWINSLPSAQPTEASCWGCNCPKMERLKEQKTFSEMVHLHDAETHEERTETHGVCLDTISRRAAIDAVLDRMDTEKHGRNAKPEEIKWTLERVPSAQPEPQWIPFKTRLLTEEEKEEYPEWDCILDCKLPDDGQAILVSINRRGHERVQYDEFYSDDGSYLDSGYAIGEEATAWMPLPDPWKGAEHETD